MVNIYKSKLTILQQEILRLLFVKAGALLNQRNIASLLDVTPPAVMKALPKLEKENLIKIVQDKESKRWSIGLNRDNYKVLQIKRADNLRQIYESGLIDFLEKEFAGATIVLFGSYSRGEDVWYADNDDRNSDIDIAIVGRKEKKINLKEYENNLQRIININFYDLWKSIHKNLRNNLFNGIILLGGVEL